MLETRKLIQKAELLYCINLSNIIIRLDIRGYRNAGEGGMDKGKPILRFHPIAIEKHYDVMVKDTLPHELAHVVTMVKHRTCLHDATWRRYCLALGGNGQRYHHMDITTKAEIKANQKQPSKKYEFRGETGATIILGLGRYNSLRLGKIQYYTSPRTGKIYFKDLIRRVQ